MQALHYTCPSCGAINRIPSERTQDLPNCGRCKEALFSGRPVELNDDDFCRFLEKNDMPVVVDFWAAWCGPCQMMAPFFNQLSAQMEQQIRFVKVDTEQAQRTSAQFNIRSIPTLIVFHKGREIDRLAGALPLPQLQQWISQAISKIHFEKA